MTDLDYFFGRLNSRTYLSSSYALGLWQSSDFGQPARNIWLVFDQSGSQPLTGNLEIEEHILTSTARRQIKLQISREAGNVREVVVQKFDSNKGRLIDSIRLDRTAAQRLIALVQALPFIPVEGGAAERIDDAAFRAALDTPEAVRRAYESNPARLQDLVAADAEGVDLIAVRARRRALDRFERLLTDGAYFAEESKKDGGPERVWQKLIEANPWILGIGLSGQFLTGWDPAKLEQSVVGKSVRGPGKVTDALLATTGTVRSLVFAEIKPHNVSLVGEKYRSGVYPPSEALVSGVTQAQQTVHLASLDIEGLLARQLPDGAESIETANFLRPRSYLLIGTLAEFQGLDRFHRRKFESFEMYRRNLFEPEIITYDELLARAQWQVSALEREH